MGLRGPAPVEIAMPSESSLRDAHTALTRFGLGPRPGECAAIASDPRAFVLAQCDRPQTALIVAPGLRPTPENMALNLKDRRERRVARKLENEQIEAAKAAAKAAGGGDMAAGDMADADMAGGDMAGRDMAGGDMAAGDMAGDMTGGDMAGGLAQIDDGTVKRNDSQRPDRLRQPGFSPSTVRMEAAARFDHGLAANDGLTERLVLFWSNHFAVSTAKGGTVPAIVGSYEREAIRPHVYGRFRDLLEAAVKHPAMLVYLDNWKSVGPNSRVGERKAIGLNENLAREVLELHTLGVDGGYTQADVTSFAKVLTGWTIDRNGGRTEGSGAIFLPRRHEPGDFTVLGKVYGQRGQRKLDAVLDDLARHPATARHIARKLTRCFVGDDAPPEIAEATARAFLDSDGDLAATTRALVSTDAAWATPPSKLRDPYLFTVASFRVLRMTTDSDNEKAAFNMMNALGQKIWTPPSPAGWPDGDDAWLAGDALLERLDFASVLARRIDPELDVPALAADVLGPRYDQPTREAVTRAESREQAVSLMLLSPGFQRI
jgi:uncharacterized protein (DUF1800 family)